MSTAVLAAVGVGKRYGPVVALSEVNLEVLPGTVHALVGENGAGKSTLGKLFSGSIQPDSGEILVDGRAVKLSTPRAALHAGVAAISQELTLVPQMSVIDNVFLGTEDHRRGMLTRGVSRRRWTELVKRFGSDLDPDVKVRDLGVADCQKVEILRVLARDARVVIMDEPTAALVHHEIETLMTVVRELAASGLAVIYVAHALDEVLAIADVVTIMRDGRVVTTVNAGDETPQTLATQMIGRPLDLEYPPRVPPPADARVVCEVKHFTKAQEFEDVSFSLQAGEILGLAGLAGSGCTEVAMALAGAEGLTAGVLEVDGNAVKIRTPTAGLKHGIALLPESRRDQGLLMNRPIRENVTAGRGQMVSHWGWVQRGREKTMVSPLLESFGVRMSSMDAPVRTLSGGNQQKVLLAKCMFGEPNILIAIQPTRGVDVGARAGIYELLVKLASEGLGVILVSTELEEISGLAHRILVFRRGRIIDELIPGEVDGDQLLTSVVGAAEA
jgi:ABC-type sugar transport system ATPase subunit